MEKAKIKTTKQGAKYIIDKDNNIVMKNDIWNRKANKMYGGTALLVYKIERDELKQFNIKNFNDVQKGLINKNEKFIKNNLLFIANGTSNSKKQDLADIAYIETLLEYKDIEKNKKDILLIMVEV